MTFSELKATLILALIFASRMLGLFMVLPVLALYADTIPYATPALIGLAAGIYGLTQALLQLPCGILSDYVGRKPVILGGLVVFIGGSLLAAFSHSIWGLILGRAVQGMGAIGSPILALVADLTREQVRTRAMAVIGISIGFTFVLAIVLGPLLDAHIGLSGIFVLTAAMAASGILLLSLLGPVPKQKPLILRGQLRVLLKHPDLWRLNLNIFILHAILTACFLVFPAKIQEVTGLTSNHVWRFYLPVLLMSVMLVAPLLRYADNQQWQKKLMKAAMIGLAIAIVIMISTTQYVVFLMAATLFFLSFNFLEASFPAMVSRVVPQGSKGSALGVYSFSQFLGMFAGGVFGGCLQQWIGPWGIGIGCLLLSLIGWLTLSCSKQFDFRQGAKPSEQSECISDT
jgi:predicted MFS family arabinose efflux permease